MTGDYDDTNEELRIRQRTMMYNNDLYFALFGVLFAAYGTIEMGLMSPVLAIILGLEFTVLGLYRARRKKEGTYSRAWYKSRTEIGEQVPILELDKLKQAAKSDVATDGGEDEQCSGSS